MQWQDKAIILGAKKHGETSAIVEVMSKAHGRHLGIVKGGRSRRMSATLQSGNLVCVDWWARLNEHLGTFRLEALDFSAARLMETPIALYAFQLMAAHLRLLPEREAHKGLYDILVLVIQNYNFPAILAEVLVRFELCLLEELGFGLDLKSCVVTGGHKNLAYVSPRSACAVSDVAGEKWKDKLLPLPSFLLSHQQRPQSDINILQGFQLTGYFLERHVFVPRGLAAPSVRASFLRIFKQNKLF